MSMQDQGEQLPFRGIRPGSIPNDRAELASLDRENGGLGRSSTVVLDQPVEFFATDDFFEHNRVVLFFQIGNESGQHAFAGAELRRNAS